MWDQAPTTIPVRSQAAGNKAHSVIANTERPPAGGLFASVLDDLTSRFPIIWCYSASVGVPRRSMDNLEKAQICARRLPTQSTPSEIKSSTNAGDFETQIVCRLGTSSCADRLVEWRQ